MEAMGPGLGGDRGWAFEISRGKLLFVEWAKRKVLVFSTVSCIQAIMKKI